MIDRIGQQLGSYRLIRLLGQGGFAEVYLGEHIRLKNLVAVKVLNTYLARSDVEDFQREAHTIVRLLHPHIIRVFDYDITGGTPYLIMDYAPNGTLRNRHPKGTRVPLANIVSYINQVADALQYAHSEKVIHRDIKPENMLLGRNHEILLSDFGVATLSQSTRYQNTQDIAGTAAYMAPEQIQGKPHQASDQYSLGIVVYEWLSGERPFHGTFTEIAIQHAIAPPPPLREKVPEILPQLEQVAMVALAKNPQQRFASVQAFANALEQASAAGPSFHSDPTYISPQSPANFLSPPVIEAPVTYSSASTAFEGQFNTYNSPGSQDHGTSRPVSSPSGISTPAQRTRILSRRTLLVGLTGLAVAGGGITWLALTHLHGPNPHRNIPVPGTHTKGTATPFSGSWSRLPSLPSPEADNVAIYVRLQQRDYIYMTGGYRGINQSPRNDDNLYRYDIAAARWEVVTRNFLGMFNNSVVQDEQNNLFFTGGYSPDNQAIATLLYKYQPDTRNLQPITPTSIVFGYGGSMIADQHGHLYLTQGFMKGYDPKVDAPAGTGWYRYNIATDQWDNLAQLPVGVGYAVLASDGQGGIVLLGGATDTQQKYVSRGIYRYNITNDAWKQEQAVTPQDFNGSAICSLGTKAKVVIVGGYDAVNNKVLNTTWLVDLITLDWTRLAPLPEGGSRLGAAACDATGNVYLVPGVINDPDKPTIDFWKLSQ